MNWHERYLHQAAWTSELRDHIFRGCKLGEARRVLEVGCGTGAVLKDLPTVGPELHGLDLSLGSLLECHRNTPAARLTRGDARRLPFADAAFEITFCHYLLLWIREPVPALLEMKRVTASSGYVIAFAEPDYQHRKDQPAELEWLGRQQNAALVRQGAALQRGAELAGLFRQAGIRVVESGTLRSQPSLGEAIEDWASEWQVLEDDLAGAVSPQDLARVKEADRQALALGRHR